MSKIKLNVQLSPLPTNFRGKPQEFAEALVARMKLVSEDDFSTFVISDSLPNSDEGPVLLGGQKWYVWDTLQSEYIPLDISDSFVPPFQISVTEPESVTPPVWLRISALTNGRALGWYYYMGESLGWVSAPSQVNSGPSTSRPTSPLNLEKFYDEDIQCEIWWERDSWRTVSGTPGDTKFVTAPNLDDALSSNPGWVEIGSVFGSGIRGRALVVASKDEAGEGTTNLPVGSGITSRAAGDQFGSETHELAVGELPVHHHFGYGAGLQTGAGTDALYTSSEADILTVASKVNIGDSYNYEMKGIDREEYPAELGPSSDVGGDGAHPNVQPSHALYLLVKL